MQNLRMDEYVIPMRDLEHGPESMTYEAQAIEIARGLHDRVFPDEPIVRVQSTVQRQNRLVVRFVVGSDTRADWSSRCVCCGASFDIDPGDQAEVVNRTTGARGVAHVECFLAETDTYQMA